MPSAINGKSLCWFQWVSAQALKHFVLPGRLSPFNERVIVQGSPSVPPSCFCAGNQVPTPCPVGTILFMGARCWGVAGCSGGLPRWHHCCQAPGMLPADFVLAAKPSWVLKMLPIDRASFHPQICVIWLSRCPFLLRCLCSWWVTC